MCNSREKKKEKKVKMVARVFLFNGRVVILNIRAL
jgi:hypothetical protein